MSRRKKNTSRLVPIEGVTHGLDKKGRFWLTIPSSGKPLYFYSGFPGEAVRVRRGRRGRRGEQGDLLEVLNPHVRRRDARCSHFGVCGGCTLQQMDPGVALGLKTDSIYARLQERFPQAVAVAPVRSPRDFAYRTKIELSFLRESDGATRLGFHRRGRFDKLVDLNRCWLSEFPPSLAQRLRDWAKRHELVGWDPRERGGDLRYLLYRRSASSGADLAVLVMQVGSVLTEAARTDFVSQLQEVGICGARLLWQSSTAGAIVPDFEEVLYGPQVLAERLGPLQFELSWKSFFQVNPPAYISLLDAMRSWRMSPPGARLLDLFCGVGSIGLYLKEPEDHLIGVELVEEAVLDARATAERNNVEARFEARSAEDWESLDCDLLFLDPPRSGCHPKLLRVLKGKAPAPELFYISCNPHRLFEELDELSQCYELIRYQAFDFFPQTHHVELLLQFRARPGC